MVSEAMWRADFGGRPDVLDQNIRLNDVPYRIIGVMPASFWFQGQGTKVWTPLILKASANRAEGTVIVVGRMKKNVTSEEANAEIAVLAHALEASRICFLHVDLLVRLSLRRVRRSGLSAAASFGNSCLSIYSLRLQALLQGCLLRTEAWLQCDAPSSPCSQI